MILKDTINCNIPKLRVLAREMKISPQAVHEILRRDIDDCRVGTIKRLVRALGLKIDIRIF